MHRKYETHKNNCKDEQHAKIYILRWIIWQHLATLFLRKNLGTIANDQYSIVLSWRKVHAHNSMYQHSQLEASKTCGAHDVRRAFTKKQDAVELLLPCDDCNMYHSAFPPRSTKLPAVLFGQLKRTSFIFAVVAFIL